jgi:hypothetical protein
MVANALSRRNEDVMEANAISGTMFVTYETLRTELQDHLEAMQLQKQLHAGSAPNGWADVDGILMFQGRAFLPDNSSLWQQVLEHAHTIGHEGCEKTLYQLRTTFYNPAARQWVREYVRSCSVCQKNQTNHLHAVGLLQPLLVPSQVWSDITMDFIEGFQKIGGKSVVLTVVDRFSKFAHFIPLSHPYSASSVVKAFFDYIVRLHGISCSIVSDRDLVFTSMFWK